MKTVNVTLQLEEKTFLNRNGETVKFIDYRIKNVYGVDIQITPKDDTGKQLLATLLNK